MSGQNNKVKLLSNKIFRKVLIVTLALGIVASSMIPDVSFAAGCILPNGNIASPNGDANCDEYGSSARYDENATPGGKITDTVLDSLESCGIISSAFFGYFDCIALFLSYVAYAIFWIVGWIVGIAGNAFSYTLGLTIDNSNYTAIPAIQTGWAFTRDITNIFFIFALLFIALSTILGIESYGAKKLLARFVIIALLVNFSLLATQGVIFITNALSYELYSAIPDGNSSLLKGTAQKAEFSKDVAGAIYRGTSQQKIFQADPSTLKPGIPKGSADAAATTALGVNMGVLITIVAGIFIMIFAAFIFIAGAFFFAVRMAMLWLLMIVAPFGFVFLVLPATKSYAQKWWTTLQSQALFAPAFMFFILITIKIAQSPLLQGIASKSADKDTTTLLFLIILQSIIVFVLLGGSLIVAKQLGIYGADGAIKMASGGAKWFRGYAGKIAGRTMVTATAPQAAKIAKSPLGRIPVLGLGAAKLAAAGRKSIDDYEKELEGLRPNELKKQLGRPEITPTKSVAVLQKLVKDGDLSDINDNTLKAVHSQMRRMNISTTDLERLRPDFAIPKEGETQEEASRKAASKQRPSDIEKMDPGLAGNVVAMKAMAESASPGNIRAFVNKGGPLYDGVIKEYKKMGDNLEDIAVALEKVGNHASANWMRQSAAAKMLGIPRGSTASRAQDEMDDEDEWEGERPRRERPSQARQEAARAQPATPGGVVLAPPGTGYGGPRQNNNT